MATQNELYEAVEAAGERCHSCQSRGGSPTDLPSCRHPRKWAKEILVLNNTVVYPGDLYYFCEYYRGVPGKAPSRSLELVNDMLQPAHSMVGKFPCPLYRRDGT